MCVPLLRRPIIALGSGLVFDRWFWPIIQPLLTVVNRVQATPSDSHFTVRFEDGDGNLLVGGDNVTPRVCDPPGCTHSEYVYAVVKQENRFFVDGIPVFSGCWP